MPDVRDISDALAGIDDVTLQLANHNTGCERVSRAEEKKLLAQLAYYNWEITVRLSHPESHFAQKLARGLVYGGLGLTGLGAFCLLGMIIYDSFASSLAAMMMRPAP